MQRALHLLNWWNGVSKFEVQKDSNPVRIGVLSAALINWAALFDPAKTHPGVVIVGVAARELSKAQAQIDQYRLGATCKAFGSYDELLADSNIDAVYISLPNGLHAMWTIKALEAGKHVLIEKPIASNANEARSIRNAAEKANKVALEAFHWRFHPAAHRVKELIESGEYGNVIGVKANMNVPTNGVGDENIRMMYNLGGGYYIEKQEPPRERYDC
jgi:predicted dehydrogenase